MATWREKAMFVIGTVQRANPGTRGDELRVLLRGAYPFGERKNWPYKVWLSAVREVCGAKPKPLTVLPMFEGINSGEEEYVTE